MGVAAAAAATASSHDDYFPDRSELKRVGRGSYRVPTSRTESEAIIQPKRTRGCKSRFTKSVKRKFKGSRAARKGHR